MFPQLSIEVMSEVNDDDERMINNQTIIIIVYDTMFVLHLMFQCKWKLYRTKQVIIMMKIIIMINYI